MLKLLAIVTLLTGTYVLGASKNRCPWALGKNPFSDTKFAGNWYLIAGSPLFEKKLSSCGKYTIGYEKTGDETSVNIKYTGTNAEGKQFTAEGFSKAYKTERTSLKLGVWKKEGSDNWSGVYKQSIVATDYDSYAVFIACKHGFDPSTKNFDRNLMAQIWSRNETLTKDVHDVLVSLLAGYDVDPESIQTADRANCA